jgi:hypothetical protein
MIKSTRQLRSQRTGYSSSSRARRENMSGRVRIKHNICAANI